MVPTRARDSRGFSLVELMITLVVLALVVGGVYGSFFRSQNQTARVTSMAEKRQQARAAIQLIERETRMAGSGWGRLMVQFSNNGVPDSLECIKPGPDMTTAALADSVRFVGAWQASTTLSAPMANAGSALTVADASGFAAGDLIILTNGSRAHLLQVTSISGNTLNHASTSIYNVYVAGTAPRDWPTSPGYAATSTRVYKATVTTYYMDRTTYRRPALMRREFGQAPQVVAYDADAFRVWYLMQDGTWTRRPNDLDFVDKIAPVVALSVTDRRLPTAVDSTWAVIRPRTF